MDAFDEPMPGDEESAPTAEEDEGADQTPPPTN